MRPVPLALVLAALAACGERGSSPPASGAISTTKRPLVDPARLPGAPPVGELFTTLSGLQYYEQKVGDGQKPLGKGSTVTVHYTGWLPDGDVFDSTIGKKPLVRRLDRVIRGWTEGIGSMRVGGKRKLIIPPQLGYGGMGRPGIPGGAKLIFDVELLAVDD